MLDRTQSSAELQQAKLNTLKSVTPPAATQTSTTPTTNRRRNTIRSAKPLTKSNINAALEAYRWRS